MMLWFGMIWICACLSIYVMYTYIYIYTVYIHIYNAICTWRFYELFFKNQCHLQEGCWPSGSCCIPWRSATSSWMAPTVATPSHFGIVSAITKLMVGDGWWWLTMVDGGWWWFLMLDGWWWLMMVDGGWWWLMMVFDAWWWLELPYHLNSRARSGRRLEAVPGSPLLLINQPGAARDEYTPQIWPSKTNFVRFLASKRVLRLQLAQVAEWSSMLQCDQLEETNLTNGNHLQIQHKDQ